VKIPNSMLFIVVAFYGKPVFGMEALLSKQQEVADQSLEDAKAAQEEKQQQQEKEHKREQEEREEQERKTREESAKKEEAKCKFKKSTLKIAGITELSASWVIGATYDNFYTLFSIDPKASNTTLATSNSQRNSAERFTALTDYFKNQRDENTCGQDYKDIIDEAIEKITAFRDFIVEIRTKNLDGNALRKILIEYQEAYFDAKTAIDSDNLGKYMTKKNAENTQREYTFRAYLVKEYAKSMIALDVNTKNFIKNFDIADRSTGMSANLNIDVRTLMSQVGTVQGAVAEELKSKGIEEARKTYGSRLSELERRIAEHMNKHTEEDDVALGVLSRTIEKLREKLGIKKK